MPIKDKSKYPDNWKEISLKARERSDFKCELCGAENGKQHHMTGSKVVLTVHHIEWTDDQEYNNSYPNLIALCQKCHLRLDLGKHMRNRLYGARKDDRLD